MKIVFLDTLTFGEDADLSAFDALGETIYHPVTHEEETLKRIIDAEVVVTNKVVITEAMMQEAKKLKLICVAATGMNNIDLEAAKRQNIPVKNVAGYSTHSVVQHTFTILFYLIGHSRYYDEYVKEKFWQTSDIFTHIGRPFSEVAGKRWGIIGMGHIGQEVAKVARAFGAQIIYYSTSGKNRDQGYESVDLSTLLSSSDIITIHAPLNEQTQNLLHYENMKLLKEHAVVINVARGGIINEADLAQTIKEKPIYVGVDVASKEPIEVTNPLLDVQSERLYITPHIAWTSVEARKTLLQAVEEHIKAFQKGL